MYSAVVITPLRSMIGDQIKEAEEFDGCQMYPFWKLQLVFALEEDALDKAFLNNQYCQYKQ